MYWNTRSSIPDAIKHTNKQTISALRAVGFKNIPIPLCNIVIIEGPKVVGQLESGPFIWHANLNDIADRNGAYHWNIPDDWTAIANGSTLTVNSITDFSNFDSKKLSVNYTTQAGSTNTDTIVVHFSDVTWVPTHNLPPLQAFNSNYEEKDVLGDDHIQIYPNPAQTKFTIKLAKGDQNAHVELFNIKGVMVKSISMDVTPPKSRTI